ncbi:MAG: hypothetical protein ACRC2J_09675 [Microcoleaceae cyanobacterium]
MAEMKLQIGADVQQAVSGLSVLQSQLERLQKIASLPGLSFNQLNRLNGMIKSTSSSIEQFGKISAKSFSRGTNEATQSLVNLSRVAQDAPYGFIGIANNLNPLLESFQRLKVSTGSTKEAFKSLASSLTGAGGIGLAIGVASSLLVVFGDKLFGSKKAAEESKEAFEAAAEAIRGISDSIDAAKSNIDYLNQLGSINIKIAGGSDIDNLRAESVSIAGLISDIRDKQAKLRAEQLKAFDSGATDDNSKKLVDERIKEMTELNSKETEALRQQSLIYARIRLAKVETARSVNKKEKAVIKEQVENFTPLKKINIGTLEKLNPLNGAFSPEAFNKLKENTGTGIKALGSSIQAGLDAINAELEQNKIQFFEQLSLERIKELSQNVSGLLTPAFEGMFDAIFQGGNVIKGFFDGLKSSVQQVIQKLITTAALAGIISAITGGAGAVGGSSFLGAFKSLLGFRANGGPVGAGSPYIVGERGPELFLPNTNGNIINNASTRGIGAGNMAVAISGSFVQRGNDLVAVIQRTNQSQRRLGA